MSLGQPLRDTITRLLAHRRSLLAAAWLLCTALALMLCARAANGAWNGRLSMELALLLALPWALAWVLRSHPGAAVDSDWVTAVARLTGYSVTINDAQRRLIWVNESFTRLTGYTAAEAIGQHTSKLLYFEGTDAGTIASVRESFAAQRGIRFEILVRGKDGREWWLDTDARPLLDASGVARAWICIQSDITEQVRVRHELQRSEREISFLAYHDPLTGLANRLGFRAKLDAVLAHAAQTRRRCIVMLIDLDRFKHVNDTLGHEVGDRLLAEVGRRIKGSVRDIDLVARLGGDEFVIVVAEVAENVTPASPSRPRMEPMVRRCCSTPTSRCTQPNIKVAIRIECSIRRWW
jgi:diguanylate cyclase (GGDEF)-like protein/PAS domain S-box-containing protein